MVDSDFSALISKISLILPAKRAGFCFSSVFPSSKKSLKIMTNNGLLKQKKVNSRFWLTTWQIYATIQC